MLSRREVIGSIPVAIGFSGCFAPGGPEYRTLMIRNYDPPKRQNDSIRISLDVEAASNGGREWGTFHEVILIGYLESETIVCRKTLGTLAPGDTRSITLTCSKKPDYLTLSTAEDLCDGPTDIDVIQVNPIGSKQPYTVLNEKRCGDSATPIPD